MKEGRKEIKEIQIMRGMIKKQSDFEENKNK
jgi:hypothetical protein